MKKTWNEIALDQEKHRAKRPPDSDPGYPAWKYRLQEYDRLLHASERETNIAIRTKNGKGYSKAALAAMGVDSEPPVNVERLRAIAIANGLLVTRMRNRLTMIAGLAGVDSEIGTLALATIKDYLS